MAKQEKSQAELYREERKKRLAKAAKKNSKKSISSQSAALAGKIITIVIVAAIVCTIGGVVFNQTGIMERSRTAFTVAEDTSVSQAELEYYYVSLYNTYSQYAQYGYASFDTSKPLAKQIYDGSQGKIEGFAEDKEPTWADFLQDTAKTQIAFAKAAKAECEKAGIELTAAAKAEIEHSIEEFTESAKNNNYSLSAFLKANFGKGMNEKLYRQILEDQQYAQLLSETKTDEFKSKVTKKQIDKEYKDNITSYAKIELAVFKIPFATTGEGDDAKVDEASKKACIAAAEKICNADSISAFNAAAKAVSAELKEANGVAVQNSGDISVADAQGTLSADTKFASWVADSKTQAGETYSGSDDDAAYAVMMVNPMHKAADVPTYDSRHILVKYDGKPAEETADTTEETAEVADDAEVADSEDAKADEKKDDAKEETKEVEVPKLDTSKAEGVVIDNKITADKAADKEAYKKVQDVLQKYLDGEHTEEAFAALVHDNSEDTGSTETGGLYADTKADGSFVPPYEAWCTEEGRKPGDVGIVEYQGEAEGGSYSGYHLIYYIGSGTYTWKTDVIETLAGAKYNEYADKLSKSDAAKTSDIDVKVSAKVVDFLDDILVRNARNSAQQQQNYAY